MLMFTRGSDDLFRSAPRGASTVVNDSNDVLAGYTIYTGSDAATPTGRPVIQQSASTGMSRPLTTMSEGSRPAASSTSGVAPSPSSLARGGRSAPSNVDQVPATSRTPKAPKAQVGPIPKKVDEKTFNKFTLGQRAEYLKHHPDPSAWRQVGGGVRKDTWMDVRKSKDRFTTNGQ